MRLGMPIFATGLTLTALLSSIPAAAQTPAEQFVQASADRAVAILTDTSLGEPDRKTQLRDFLSTVLDLRRMATYTLGTAAKSASAADVDAFVAAYRNFAIANYNSAFSSYSGQTIHVTGSVQRSDTDFVVTTEIVDAAPKSDPPTLVSFRVVKEDGKFAVVDANVQGVWFTVSQHDGFTSFLSQHNGDVPTLTTRLGDMTAKLESGESKPAIP